MKLAYSISWNWYFWMIWANWIGRNRDETGRSPLESKCTRPGQNYLQNRLDWATSIWPWTCIHIVQHFKKQKTKKVSSKLFNSHLHLILTRYSIQHFVTKDRAMRWHREHLIITNSTISALEKGPQKRKQAERERKL